MAVDLTGGLDPAREFVLAAQPTEPEMRESVNVWMWDDGVEFGMPRIGIEAVGARWDTHDVQCNIALAGGRLLLLFEPGKAHEPRGIDGKARILGAGPLSFELVEPFVHWRMRLRGAAVATTAEAQITGNRPSAAERVPVELDVDLRSAAPPFENGSLRADAARVLAEQEEGILMGGPRFEQLFRAQGTFTVDGKRHALNGGGLRIRRSGIRRIARFWGHAWQSAVFPSGKAFGHLVYPPRADGKPTYNEGYVFDGDGALVPARVVEAPWLRRMQPRGEDVSVVLETERGKVRIHGETLLSAFHAIPVTADSQFPILHQCIARYTWDGESANGMLERSSLPDQVERPGSGS
jgi:hypothetical protein